MKEDTPPETIDATFDWNTVYAGTTSDYLPPNDLIMGAIDGLPPGRCLDVGCGAGGLLVALARLGWRVAGIDIAHTAIAAARAVVAEHGVEAQLEVADAGAWRPDGAFDLITNSFALPFGVDVRAGLFAMVRDALAPGGTVVIQDFDASMARSGFLAGSDLVTVDELRGAFPGFGIVRAEVVEVPPHEHGSDAAHAATHGPWTAALFHARKPDAQDR